MIDWRKKHQKKKQSLVSYHKKPNHLTVDQWQKELRKSFVVEGKQSFVITYLDGEHPVFADWLVENPASGGKYKVALRSRNPGPNFCACMDFKTNTLGTCKHIEAVIQKVLKNKMLKKSFHDEYRPSYTSLYLKYGGERRVMMRVGADRAEKFEQLSREFCDREYRLLPSSFDRIDEFLDSARKIDKGFRCYEDALNFIIATRENRNRKSVVNRKIAKSTTYFDNLLSTKLFPFQQEGILFAARAGRCLIADDMGLGKTIQAIGASELFRKELKIGKVLIVCPTSLKYQWKSEIEKFTPHLSSFQKDHANVSSSEHNALTKGAGFAPTVTVVEGTSFQRRRVYETDSVYTIASYNVVGADLEAINKTGFDLVILDEAQRIKNWKTRTAREVKKIISKYALVLTGTPIENKLEELYSIVQFIDPFRLGPLYKFLDEHQIRDDKTNKIVGYRELNQIKTVLSDIVIRRTKKEVLKQLPGRTDKQLFVPLTPQQFTIHQEYAETVSKLVSKWKRFGFLDEKDRQILLLSMNCMRMVSDSTYILDQETRHDTKIGELMSILENVFSTNGEKVVVFSQWERMTRLVGAELEHRKVGFANLHGGVPSRDRKDLLSNFHNDPNCRVFLSTDAGGVGLNLQCASTVVNLDLPWNPAVLEQRIGRVHRHGQKNNVNVVNLISLESIEHRMLDVLAFKSSLFAGALDGGANEIFMGEDRFKKFMNEVEKVATVPVAPAAPVTDVEVEGDVRVGAGRDLPLQDMGRDESRSPATTQQPQIADLFSSAMSFFDNLAATFADPAKSEQLVSSLVAKDTTTGKSYLKIPVENEEVVSNVVNALGTLFAGFNKKA